MTAVEHGGYIELKYVMVFDQRWAPASRAMLAFSRVFLVTDGPTGKWIAGKTQLIALDEVCLETQDIARDSLMWVYQMRSIESPENWTFVEADGRERKVKVTFFGGTTE
jgi:hypothetical protein